MQKTHNGMLFRIKWNLAVGVKWTEIENLMMMMMMKNRLY